MAFQIKTPKAFKEFAKLAKVGLDLNSCQPFFMRLKSTMKFENAESPFDFLNKLISSEVIYPRMEHAHYENLTRVIIELSDSGLPKQEYTTAAKILERFGIQLQTKPITVTTPSIEPLVISPERTLEKDAGATRMETSEEPKSSNYAIIAKFDIDHLRGMVWPDQWYKEFKEKTENLFGGRVSEIFAENSNDFTKKIEQIISKINFKKVYIIIFGFSPCFSESEPIIPGHVIIPIAGNMPEAYNLEKIYDVTNLESKKTYILLFTLPGLMLQFRNKEEMNKHSCKYNVRCRIPSNALFFQCPVTSTKVWTDKVMEYDTIYDKLEDQYFFPNMSNYYIYLNNTIQSETQDMETTDGPGNEGCEGLVYSLVLGKLDRLKKMLNGLFKERFADCRNWKFELEEIEISHKNEIPKGDPDLQDIASEIDLKIKACKGLKYLIIILQSGKWEKKEDSIKSYINIVNTFSEKLEEQQHDLTKIFMNYNTKDVNDFVYKKEDAHNVEKGIKYCKKTFFILSDRDFLLQLSSLLRFDKNSEKQFSHFLKPTVAKTIEINKRKDTRNFNFAEVVSSPDCVDFLFPTPNPL